MTLPQQIVDQCAELGISSTGVGLIFALSLIEKKILTDLLVVVSLFRRTQLER